MLADRDINESEQYLHFNSLLPVAFEEQRLQIPIYVLGTQGDPRKTSFAEFKSYREGHSEIESVHHTMINGMDTHVYLPGPRGLALVRKKFPHSHLDMMVLSTEEYSETTLPSLFDYSHSTRISFLTAAKAFSQFTEEQGLYPTIAFTYDPDTVDRKSGQSVKTFHLHLNTRTPQEREEILNNRYKLGDINKALIRRKFVDESSIVMSFILSDYFNTHPLKSLLEIRPFTRDMCPNIQFQFLGEWDDISTREFDTDFMFIHNAMVHLFNLFKGILTTGESGVWQRPLLNPKGLEEKLQKFGWLSEETIRILHHFLHHLQTSYITQNQERFKRLQSKDIINSIYPLAGLCYAISIHRSMEKNLMLSVRPQLFADTGGAGLLYIFDTQVKLERGTGNYSEEELSIKKTFEKDCSNYIAKFFKE